MLVAVMITIARPIGYILFLRHLVNGAWNQTLNIKENMYDPRGTAANGTGVGFSSVLFHPRLY